MKNTLLFLLFLACFPILSFGQFWEYHWIGENLSFTGSGGDALTVTKTECEEAFVVVTDPVGAPLASFSPIIINPKDENGDDITDISTFPLQFTIRARSAEQVEVSALFRSDDGSNDFRTNRVSGIIPAGLEEWTVLTLEVSQGSIGGFNANNLRDFWFYLDRGTENFAGNEFYIDYIALGGPATPGLESTCLLGESDNNDTDTLIFAEYFNTNEFKSINTSSSAGQVTTFTLDTLCETLGISITDPTNNPLPAFNAYLVNPIDTAGSDITDISGGVNVSMRVRSKEAIEISVLFRSGEGGSSERSDRKAVDIPAGLDQWTDFTIAFDSSEYAGFNPADLRDMWFYLDRGVENFAGNELYIDHIVIGGMPDSSFNSPCSLVEEEPMVTTFEEYFQGDSIRSINTGSAAGQATTFILDTLCETLGISITDTTNNPLPAFNAYLVNPIDTVGNDITDITGGVNVSMRVRSKEAIEISVLFRSGEGGSSERSDRKAVDIPAGLDQWTDFTIAFDSSEYAGFNPANLRDMWFYLDRGVENFAGNELYIDHIVIGGMPDSSFNSPCNLVEVEPTATTFEEYFQGDSIRSINTGSTAGQVTTFTLDTLCETLQLSVTDPDNAPLPSFNAYIVNPIDANGNDITDISENINVRMRVRSLAAVNVDVLFRSGGGTSGERTERKSVSIPAGLDQWTSFSVEFTPSDLAGFNPGDLRDFWFYLDRGTPNFAGNEFYIDYIIIGAEPDSTRFSPCSTEIESQGWVENWDSDSPTQLGGAETEKLTLTQTDCEEIKIEVTDPDGNPHQAFRPIVINPMNASGSDLSNISENVQVVIRARSAEEVPIGVLLRSGDGSTDFRTAILTQNVVANQEAWSTLVYNFTEEDLGGFNPEDLVDLWIFLDRDNNNFPGNELYIDYIAIGEQPDSTLNSPCGLPDIVVGTNTVELVSFFEVYPNPVTDRLQIRLDRKHSLDTDKQLSLYDAYGRLLIRKVITRLQDQVFLDVANIPSGLLYLQIDNGPYQFTKKIIKR